MKRLPVFAIALGVFASCAAAHAVPFGVASAFNLVALSGNISDNADITGRIAAAGYITQSTTIGSNLAGNDPYGSEADGYAMVAGKGITASNYFNINGGGNVYAPSNSAGYNWNENPKGSLITSGPSPIDFTALATQMDALSSQLDSGSAGSAGVICSVSNSGTIVPGGGCPTSSTHYNPSSVILYGTSSGANVFDISAAQFSNPNDFLDIVVPAGSTIIVNVTGCSAGTPCTLKTSPYVNGVQDSDASDVLFNFPSATTVTFDSELGGSVLAPYAYLSGNGDLDGNIIAASIGQTGEVHYVPFDGNLPPTPNTAVTPEPNSLILLGTGLLLMFGVLRRRRA